MHEVQTVLWLLVAVVVLATAAQKVAIPYPIVLVLGGVLIGAVDFLPNVELEPEIVFIVFLPPALFIAAAGTDWTRFRQEVRPITALAVNLVLTTMLGVAAVGVGVIAGLDWSTAFVLGAIVSPPDAVATLSIVKALPVPRRIVSILEGESLINDATALVAYRFAVAAVVSGSFSIVDAGMEFVWVVIGGIAIGTAVALAATWFLDHFVEDPSLSMVATMLLPVAAYMPAEELHASGVLAAVAAGLVYSRFAMLKLSAEARLQVGSVARFVSFLIDGLVFILIGLQLPAVLNNLESRSWGTLIWYGAAISVTTILIRVLWVGFAFEDRQGGPRRMRRMQLGLGQSERLVIGWAGPRGVVTLATALALPYTTDAGTPFPERDLIIFLAFCVILATLVGQGFTLPILIRRQKFADDTSEEQERLTAKREIALAALAKIDEFANQEWISQETANALRGGYKRQFEQMQRMADAGDRPKLGEEKRRLFQEMMTAQREALYRLNQDGEISDSVRRSIEHTLDLQESART
jgi:CPA1 family monovalent cation:H+ antiporter